MVSPLSGETVGFRRSTAIMEHRLAKRNRRKYREPRGPVGANSDPAPLARACSVCHAVAVDDAARQRALRRRENPQTWPVRRFALGDEPIVDPLEATSIDERLALMWPLAVQMWTLAGRPMPAYERSDIPGVLIRRAPR